MKMTYTECAIGGQKTYRREDANLEKKLHSGAFKNCKVWLP
jgi:hypothetical protein